MEKSYSSLFTMAELQAMQENWERKEADERDRKLAEMQAAHEEAKSKRTAIPTGKSAFIYQARTPEQWEARANQKRQRPIRRYGRKEETTMTLPGFEPEKLIESRERYEREHPQPRTKVEISQEKVRVLLSIRAKFPDLTVAELAESTERSPSWVRKTLRSHGVSLAGQRSRHAEPTAGNEVRP